MVILNLNTVPKHQRSINGIEDKILEHYATGMTTRDISEQIKELYEVDIMLKLYQI